MHSRIIALVLLTLTALCLEQPYRKIIHNTDPLARCLDGTLPGFYLHQGGDTSNFLIFFVGGGFCQGSNLEQLLQSCYQRSKGDTGSSKNWSDQLLSPGGYLSTDPNSSAFATWTKVVIFYCDGAFHQGSTLNPFKYKNTELYLRGSYNTRSHLQWLMNHYQLTQAKRVVFTGASSGGIATYLWTNYLRARMDNPDAVYAIPDSGIFVDFPSPKTGARTIDVLTRNLYAISNVDEATPLPACNRAYPGEEYKCLSLQYSFPFVEGRLLAINSQYDEVAIELLLALRCLTNGIAGDSLEKCNLTEIAQIESYRTSYLAFVATYLQNEKNSIWTISCAAHSYACYKERYDSPQEMIPAHTGLTVRTAVESFVFNHTRVTAVDSQNWPNNPPCAQ